MKDKLISCKACGAEISKNAKYCPHCGEANKKPIYKKWWFWLIIVVLIVSIGNGNDDTTSDPASTTPPSTQAPTTAPTTEPTIETTEATTEPVTEQETLSGAEAADLVIAMMELSVAGKFDYHKIEGDETGITLSIAMDGLAQDMVIAGYSGKDENYEPWVDVKENMVGLCNTIHDSAVQFGMDNPIIMVNVLNDQNHENILLGIMNGIVIYDALAG